MKQITVYLILLPTLGKNIINLMENQFIPYDSIRRKICGKYVSYECHRSLHDKIDCDENEISPKKTSTERILKWRLWRKWSWKKIVNSDDKGDNHIWENEYRNGTNEIVKIFNQKCVISSGKMMFMRSVNVVINVQVRVLMNLMWLI